MTSTDSPADDPTPTSPDAADLDTALAAVANLRRTAEQFAAQVNAPRSVVSDDGHTVIGSGGRLRSVTLDRSVTEQIGHGVDPVALARDLLTACRGALLPPVPTGALSGGVDTGGAVPPDPALVEQFAARTFAAQGADGAVTATVAGTGELAELQIAASAVRGEALSEVGENVVAAVNAAVAAYRQARAETFGLGDLAATLKAKTDAFAERMDAVRGEIDSSRAQMQAKLSEVEGLLAQRRR